MELRVRLPARGRLPDAGMPLEVAIEPGAIHVF